MKEETFKDKGVRKAMREQPTFKLSSNFAYQTMQKVDSIIHLRERQAERRTLFATILAAIFLAGGCTAVWIVYYGAMIPEFHASLFPNPTEEVSSVRIPSFYLLLLLALPLFLGFDYWMRKQYFKNRDYLPQK